jgi:hypothetical protein
VDFPNGKEQSAELKKQNEALSEAFAIQAFPTLMLCDSDGRPYAEAGFPEEMTPASMQTVLESAMKSKLVRDEAFAKAEKAEGVAKAKLLVEALTLVPAASVASAYSSTVDEIAKADPEDETGFVKKARTEKLLAELESGFGELMQAEKVDDAIKLIDTFIKDSSPDGEAKQKALMFKVFGLATKEQFEAAMGIADEIVKIDGSTETAGMAKQIKRQLENQ